MLPQTQWSTLIRLVAPHRRWYERATGACENKVLRTLFPYGVYAAGIWLFFLPYLVVGVSVVAGTAWVVAPASTLVAAEYVTSALSEPVVVAAGLAGGYAVSLFKYYPVDKNGYGPDGQSTPTAYEEFESMMTVMCIIAFPLIYFLLRRFESAVAPYLATTRLSPFTGALVGMIGTIVLVYTWMHHRYGRNRTVKPQMASFWGFLLFTVPITLVYYAQIPLGFDRLLYGSSANPVEAAFAPVIALLAFTMRRLRWTVNEDLYGFPSVNPVVPVWGLPRVAFVFGAVAVWRGAPLSEPVVGACLAPLVGGVLYLGWRMYITGDGKPAPRGFLSSPGRGLYEKNRKENERAMAEIVRLSESVKAFNEFASEQGLDTLPEPSLSEYDSKGIESALDEIDTEDARALTGDTFTRYAELRDEVWKRLD